MFTPISTYFAAGNDMRVMLAVAGPCDQGRGHADNTLAGRSKR